MRAGIAVIGDTQYLPGYTVLLADDPAADHLTDLPRDRRAEFLLDLSLIGEALQAACAANGLRRVNYEVLGNSMPRLHGHVHPRYDWEPADLLTGPVWRYPSELVDAPEHAYDDARHGALRAAITEHLERVMREAYDDV